MGYSLDSISDDERLYRAIRKSKPNGFIDGKPTAALFIDPNGTSVDRDGGRNEDVIVTSFKERFSKREDYGGSVKITARKCRMAGACPLPRPSKSNEYHAEIHESEDIIEISFVKAVQLAEECEIVMEEK